MTNFENYKEIIDLGYLARAKTGRPLSEEHKLAISKGFKNNKLNKKQ